MPYTIYVAGFGDNRWRFRLSPDATLETVCDAVRVRLRMRLRKVRQAYGTIRYTSEGSEVSPGSLSGQGILSNSTLQAEVIRVWIKGVGETGVIYASPVDPLEIIQLVHQMNFIMPRDCRFMLDDGSFKTVRPGMTLQEQGVQNDTRLHLVMR